MDLTQYMPTPFTIEYGPHRLTSPVPTVKAGKLIKAITEYQMEAARKAADGEEAPTPPEQLNLTDDEAGVLLFGEQEWGRVDAENMPALFAQYAIIAAQAYWAAGGNIEAAEAYIQAVSGHPTSEPPKVGKNRKLSKNGADYGIGDPVGFGEHGEPIYDNYRAPTTQTTPHSVVVWGDIVGVWPLVQADLAHHYHLAEPAIQDAPWPWFLNLIYQLVANPDTLTNYALTRA